MELVIRGRCSDKGICHLKGMRFAVLPQIFAGPLPYFFIKKKRIKYEKQI